MSLLKERGGQVFFHQNAFSYDLPFTYEYRLDETGNWNFANGSQVDLSRLNSGDYSLQIRPVSSLGEKGATYEMAVKIVPPFWKSAWFIILCILIVIGLLILIFRFFLSRVNAKRQKEYDQLALELKVLVAQMNPHFTFNTINSIQSFIVRNDKKEALNYLGEFAHLMRRALDYSRREFVTLKEELEFISLYVDLEQRRFINPFDFTIKFDGVTEPEKVQLPALLLQPLIENAIVHGVSGRADNGKIEVAVSKKGNQLIICVKDNGPGIPLTNPKLKGAKNSYGTEIIRERIKLYHGKLYQDSDLSYFSPDKADQKGTKVVLKLYLN